MIKYLKKIKIGIFAIWRELIISLPDEFSKFRVAFYNRQGCKINRRVSISPNVRIRGVVEIGEGSSVAQNCSISGQSAGVRIGCNVMLAPNVVIIAFSHGTSDILMPMSKQPVEEEYIIIEDDVWIGANVTIGKGVTIGSGSIVGANSFVNTDVAPRTIVAGSPARFIKFR